MDRLGLFAYGTEEVRGKLDLIRQARLGNCKLDWRALDSAEDKLLRWAAELARLAGDPVR